MESQFFAAEVSGHDPRQHKVMLGGGEGSLYAAITPMALTGMTECVRSLGNVEKCSGDRRDLSWDVPGT